MQLQVLYDQKQYSLENPQSAFALLFELYNFAGRIIPENARFLQKFNLEVLVAATQGLGLPPLYSQPPSKRSHNSAVGSSGPSKRQRSGKGAQDDLVLGSDAGGVGHEFTSDLGIMSTLAKLGLRIDKNLLPKVGSVISCHFLSQTLSEIVQTTHGVCGASMGSLPFVIKCVPDEHSLEVRIHQELASFKDRANLTIPLLHVIQLQGKTIMAMPLELPFEIWKINLELLRQLLAGIGFMHSKRIAHLDLKPGNLLLSHDGSRLNIIDFGLSVSNVDRTSRIRGFRGTVPWVAPEVGEEDGPAQSFDPIAADLWALGRIVRHSVSYLTGDNRTRFSAVAAQLQHHEPN
jgi:hypothetical protein